MWLILVVCFIVSSEVFGIPRIPRVLGHKSEMRKYGILAGAEVGWWGLEGRDNISIVLGRKDGKLSWPVRTLLQ